MTPSSTTSLFVLDLFSGLGGFSQAFAVAGHKVITLDIDPSFEPDLCVDIFDFRLRMLPSPPDVILASPPCQAFSVGSIKHHWTWGPDRDKRIPASDAARHSIRIVERTLKLIAAIRPPVAVIENPTGMMRHVFPQLKPYMVHTWLCHYGLERAKPTDLWGLPFPKGWQPRKTCHYGGWTHGEHCCCKDHISVSSGANEGVQAYISKAERALLPYELGESLLRAMSPGPSRQEEMVSGDQS